MVDGGDAAGDGGAQRRQLLLLARRDAAHQQQVLAHGLLLVLLQRIARALSPTRNKNDESWKERGSTTGRVQHEGRVRGA